jgi:hypothetical protein
MSANAEFKTLQGHLLLLLPSTKDQSSKSSPSLSTWNLELDLAVVKLCLHFYKAVFILGGTTTINPHPIGDGKNKRLYCLHV